MIYAYIRVSTDKQTVENQRFELIKFAKEKNMKIERWVAETNSRRKSANDRKLGVLIRKMKKDDVLFISEISRLGGNLLEIMSILHTCMLKETMVYTAKERYELGNNINSQVLAFAFGLVAQIEVKLISQRVKETAARVKAEGGAWGRKEGSKSSYYKLTGKEKVILQLLSQGTSKSAIARKLKVHRCTLDKYIKEHLKRPD